MRIWLTLGAMVAATSAAHAEMKLQPASAVPYVNASGFTITQFAVQASPTGCEGSQTYEDGKNPDNKGRSILVWSSSNAMQGGVACRGGAWLYGGGPKLGQRGGRMGDIFVKDGAYFWIVKY